ncbi:hypothetical protein [Paradevosia shaoguanensis]|jgi:hypothetical protein|uniref:Uncharacterized protein n=1 Tax=Paradevosia shaoguanensis TaxID=1335043 RepID=A0AA41UH01_9HYPH|nr:hypothetical protein [Paradevosia shaoguanensis]KFL27388.1 hypothetical protein JP74_07290 [Devosia sp. 17-2-E-8]QMV01272.1 hypothetical protein GHV40_07185 [Devosia sp. D6-9]CDP50863.1 hypothetical protein [Devosia sp. DBB001]MCF1743403.1 hypothetical protein [Paradevosia shaoguanensis]MCI0127886.1 hypothetical protein [Paradevosia shaoguanensis]
MINISKLATALVLAAVVAVPASGAFAASAASAPAKPAAMKMAPVTDPSGLVGRWSAADISGIDTAKAVKIVDLRKAYGAKDLKMIEAAAKADKAGIAKLHTALNGDSKFKAWAKKNHVSPARVVGVSNGEVAFL